MLEANVVLMMDTYGKCEQEDLSTDEKAVLKSLSDHFKREILRRANRESAT
jgi:hypothetical protein